MHGRLAPTRRRSWQPSSPSSGTSPPRWLVSGLVTNLPLLPVHRMQSLTRMLTVIYVAFLCSVHAGGGDEMLPAAHDGVRLEQLGGGGF